MIYGLLKIWTSIAMRWFIPALTIRHASNLRPGKPTLLVANHPDSFLDAIIIAIACKGPIHFLARGDVFTKPWQRTILRVLNMYPVYRIREGREHVHLNRITFRHSNEVLANGGTLLIFIEGICLQTHELQPFKKGAARIAWEAATLAGCSYIPVGVAYSSFTQIGKAATVVFGEPVFPKQIFEGEQEQPNLTRFNQYVFPKLQACIQVPEAAISYQSSPSLLFIYRIAIILHLPFYFPIRNKVASLTRGTVFYDSVLYAVLLFLYPAYLLLMAYLILFFSNAYWTAFLAFMGLPALAYYVLSRRLVLKSTGHGVSS
ncbi:MAG: hypothetical protein FGM61_02480 [Sediminibacterium sp.]|nr:hypothetical protein [Sediminibacterium sp.]